MELSTNAPLTSTLPRSTKVRSDRPASLYDNLRGCNGGGLSNASSTGGGLGPPTTNASSPPVMRSPPAHNGTTIQSMCLNTTVPQNMAGNIIAGRHTPTRNSLRHSRMIVLNRTGKVHRKHMPHVLRQYRLGRALAALQTIVGCAIATLATWLIVWAPRLPTRDIPYWSGFPLMFSGILGLVLLCCCRKDYPGQPYNCHIFIFKVLSIIVSILAGGACFCATAFGVLHLVFLSRSTCEPTNVLNSTCVCRSVTDSENITDITAKVYRYSDLNCLEVRNILSVLLIGSAAANFFGGLLISWYIYLHWSSRYSYVYSNVRTNENKPIIISNKI